MQFKRVLFRNIMSYGQVDNEIQFNKSTNKEFVGILGENGMGKSSILDVIFFGLFGVPYRQDINKADLKNRYNKKGLYVECEFENGGNTYIIKRGMTPTFIEIEKNGESQVVDDKAQIYINKNILGIDENTFRLFFMIGINSFKSFYKLSLDDKRKLIEYMSGIHILTLMSKQIKPQKPKLEQQITQIQTEINHHEKMKTIYQNKIQSLKVSINTNNDSVEKYNKQLILIENTLSKINEKIQNINIDNIEKMMANILDEDEKLKKYNNDILSDIKIKNKENQDLQKLIDFLKTHDNCPVCTQPIDIEFKNNKIKNENMALGKNIEIIDKLQEKTEKCNNKLIKNKSCLLKYKEKTEKYQSMVRDYNELKNKQSLIIEKKKLTENNIDDIIGSLEEDIKKTDIALNETIQNLNVISNELININLFIEALGDNGIKKQIYQKVTSAINANVNEYRIKFQSNTRMKIDNALNVTFYNKIGESIRYGSFSTGERLIMDFSFIFGGIKFVEDFYGFNIDLLCFDEIFDSSFDASNQSLLLDILKELTETKNILVITHNKDISNVFDSCYHITRDEYGFSNISMEK